MTMRDARHYTLPYRGNLRAVKQNRVIIADGNAHFNRPGPRLVDALEFLVGVCKREKCYLLVLCRM
jgi:iron complex transport system substrate-binding protein